MRRNIICYNPSLKEKARELRKHSTRAEIILWLELKGKQLMGYDFHRQKPLYEFIVDFFCNELNLAIELDGESHLGKEKEDKEREIFLAERGIKILRFDNSEVIDNTEKVLETIKNWINVHSSV